MDSLRLTFLKYSPNFILAVCMCVSRTSVFNNIVIHDVNRNAVPDMPVNAVPLAWL